MATNPALWTSTAQTEMYRFFAVAFNAAPGTTYMDQLYDAVTSGMSTEQIVEVFTSKSQFTNVYPRFMSNKDFATKLVNNVVGSSATDAAKATAVADIEAALASGYSRGKVVYQIFTNLANKTADDATWAGTAKQMANQVAVSKYYTETLLQGGENLATLQKVIAGVTKDTAVGTTAALQSIIDTAVPTPGQTFTLTTGVDNPSNSTGPDLYAGTVNAVTAAENTYSASDVIDGGAGTDTLQITVANSGGAGNATTFLPVQQKVEVVRIVNVDAAAASGATTTHTFDANASSTLARAEVASGTDPVIFTNLAGPAAVKLSASSNGTGGDATFVFKATSLTGTSDTVDLTLTSNGTQNVFVGSISGSTTTLGGGGIEAATIAVEGTNAPATLIGLAADLKTATITGGGNLTIDSATSMAAVTKLDASANTGGVRFTAVAVNSTIMGGAGADTLTGSTGNDTITGGAGADTITAGAGNDSVDAGAGNDTVTLQSGVNKNDTIVGGDGTDVLIVSSALGYSTTSGTNDASGISGFETIRAAATVTQNMKALATNNTIATAVLGGGSLTLQESPTIATLTGSTAGTFTIGLATNGTADTLQVNVGSASGTRAVTVNANDYETINVASSGTAGNTVTIGATQAGTETVAAAALTATTSIALTGITVTGSKDVTVNATSNALSLASVDASAFTGNTFAFSGTSTSTKAIAVKANGAYAATITTADGADTVTLGDPGTGTGHNVSTNAGADTVTSGSGNDTIDGGDGNNVILGGAGNDSITGSSGTAATGDDWFKGEAGDDTLVGNAGADTLEGGDGSDSLNGGAGADSIIGGDGNDNVDSGSGSDFVSGGAGADTINAGAGDDTVDGGAGNDVITIASLTSGDSIDGGDGTADRLTLTTVASDATPSGIANIEDFRITTFGVGSSTTGITVDFNKVSGISSMTLTNNSSAAATNTLKSLPTALKTINMADTAALTAADTLALTYSSGPSTLTINAFDVMNAATNITSLNAPLAINGKLTTNLAGDAQVFTGAEGSYLGAMTTDASTITLSTDALPAGTYSGFELGVGAITDTVLQSLTISAGAYADIGIGDSLSSGMTAANVTTTNSEFSALTVSTGTGAAVKMGTLTADSATAVAVGINPGTQGSITVGNMSVAAGSIALSGTLGDQATVSLGSATGKSITSSNFTTGAGSSVTLPTLLLAGTASSSSTIGAVTLNAGVSSTLTQTIANSGTAPYSVGAITAQGSGNVVVTLGAINASSTATTKVGAISASAMTSPLSSFKFTGTNAATALNITGGAGNDTILGGSGVDTITAGAGADSIDGATGADLINVSAGHSNAVAGTSTSLATGQDNIVIGSGDLIRVTLTSTDTSFDFSTHVTAGSGSAGGNGTDTSAAAAFADTAILVQAGAVASGDTWDFVFNSVDAAGAAAAIPGSGGSAAAYARSFVAVNVTGTAGDDTLAGGANADTLSGSTGADTISGLAGNDSLSGGDGNDTLLGGTGADTLVGGNDTDVFQFAAGDSALTVTLGTASTTAGSVSGADVVSGYRIGDGTTRAELLDTVSTAALVAAGTYDNADKTVVYTTATTADTSKVFATFVVSSTGLVTFYDAAATPAAITVTSGMLAGAVAALQAVDLGDAGATVAFAVGSDYYLFTQGDNSGTDNQDILVRLVGVDLSGGLTTSSSTVTANTGYIG